MAHRYDIAHRFANKQAGKNDILKTSEIAMSDVYVQYLLGWAYIPIQDLPKYEKAYKKVKINNKREVKL